MTTEMTSTARTDARASARPPDRAAGRALARTVLAGVVFAGLAAGCGGLLAGRPAALGALAGALLAVSVLAWGVVSLHVVARLAPALSLVFALLTYTLQILLLAGGLVALSTSDLLDGTLDRAWVGGTVIAATLLWMVAHVVAATRARIPHYEPASPAGAALHRTLVSTAAGAGER